MARPQRTISEGVAIIPSTSQPSIQEQIDMGIENMTMYPEDAPAVQEAMARAKFAADRAGERMTFGVQDIDPTTLPGTTVGDSFGSGSSANDAMASRLEALAEGSVISDRQKAQILREHQEAQAQAAAASGVSVSGLFDNASTRKRILAEPRHTVMVSSLPNDPYGARSVMISINCIEFEVSIGVPVSLPYSVMSAMVEQGRCAPPRECPELIVQAIHAAHSQNRTITAGAEYGNGRNGKYFGASANGMSALELEQTVADAVRRELSGRGAGQQLLVPPPSSSGVTRF